jgi:hypothetical protein
VLHVLGVGGYRSGFLGVFVPLALATGLVTWLAVGRRADRVLWTSALVVLAATAAGLLTSAAPPSRAVLLDDARTLLPNFSDEVSHETTGHSWCRPHCPVATVVAEPAGTGAPAVMVEVATVFFQRGDLTQQELVAIARQRTFVVRAPDVGYRVSLIGQGDARRLRIELSAR